MKYQILKRNPEIIIVTGTTSACGKTTLAKKIAETYCYNYISLDDCKYGDNWSLKNTNEFRRNILMEMYKTANIPNKFEEYKSGDIKTYNYHIRACLDNNNRYVIDGIYCDPKFPSQKDTINYLIHDLHQYKYKIYVIWNYVPIPIIIWRILWRSFTRRLGLCEQGSCNETLWNVYDMIVKNIKYHNYRYKELNSSVPNSLNLIEGNKYSNKYFVAWWPFQYDI